jgi:Flp pilus assembly CpaE family ATPase
VNFGFITALTSFEQEDIVVDSLISRDFSLLCRAMQPDQLIHDLGVLGTEKRVIVIIDELFGLNTFEISQLRSEYVACLELPSDARVNRDELISLVDAALRKPEETTATKKRITGSKKWIAFTGSSGSPGISTISLNVAAELALMHDVNLIDADPHRGDLNTLLGLKSDEWQTPLNPRLLLWNQKLDKSLNQFSQLVDDTKEKLTCIDIGDAPNLHELLTDRRNEGKRYLETLVSCGRIVFIGQPDSHSLYEMEEFSCAIQESLPHLPITFVLNKAGTSNRQQAIQKRFRAKVNGKDNFLIPREDSILDRAQSRYATVVEISPRSPLRKSLRQLSVHLATVN